MPDAFHIVFYINLCRLVLAVMFSSIQYVCKSTSLRSKFFTVMGSHMPGTTYLFAYVTIIIGDWYL